MSCVTCEVTPPEGHGGPMRIDEGHIGGRLGDAMGLGLCVLYRGYDVTLQCVEAHAGDENDGWVEMRVVTSDGTPTIHPATDPICPNCQAPRDWGVFPCPACGSDIGPTSLHPAHVVTVIRYGVTQVARGSVLVNPQVG